MDINAIDKIADRRRLLEDVDKIQAKVSKENKEILKIQIGQDCAFWDQKQKLADVKGEHERLQQNMLQLQYEELSSKYQAELRARPELINKLNHTYLLVDELENAMQQCMEHAARDKKVREALVELYAAADRKVCSLKQQYETVMEQAKSRADELQLKLKEKNEQNEQLTEKYQDSQMQLHTLKSVLEAARSDCKELSASREDMKKKLEATNIELHQREAAISNLQREMRNIDTNFHNQLTEAKNILVKKDNDLKSAAEEIESLKIALSNQEEFAKMQCDCNNEMLEKLALVEEQHQQAETSNDANKKKLQFQSQSLADQREELPTSSKTSKQVRPDASMMGRAARRNDEATAAQSQLPPVAAKLPKQARHHIPATSRANGRNDAAAADAGTADSTAKPRRFFKTPRNRSKIYNVTK